MKTGFMDKLVDRLDRLDPGSLQTHFLRLAREKGLLETIFHTLQEGIAVLDSRGRIAYANRAAARLLGFELEGIEGTPIGRFLKEIEWDRVLKLDVAEWSRLVNREIEVSYPEHRFLAFYVVPLQLVRPAERGAVLILRDMTRDRESAAKSIESERLRAITLLAAGVAHEIGNPLNSLNIHLQLLRREIARTPGPAQEEMRELADVAGREVARLDQIITQFLHAVRPVTPNREASDLGELVRDALEFMKHEVADRDVVVECEGGEGLPAVEVDRQQIRQVFFNVIKNAVQAMPGGGVLHIGLAGTDRFVAVSFRDTGSGISREQIGNIFDPYYTTKASGSGLGLMIVQRIVRDHGGEIEIHSEPSRGTTFTLLLPRADREIRLLRARPPDAEGGGEDAAFDEKS